MASPGQRRGSCGHVMAGFDLHQKCARCRDKKLGSDNCVKRKDCQICEDLKDSQRSMLSSTQYQIRKDKRAGLLVSPSKVTVGCPVEDMEAELDVHAQPLAGPSSLPDLVPQYSGKDFVSMQDFDILNNQLEEKCARFKALLTRTNIFSIPKAPVTVVNPPVSDTPFIKPTSDTRATSPVPSQGQKVPVKAKENKSKRQTEEVT